MSQTDLNSAPSPRGTGLVIIGAILPWVLPVVWFSRLQSDFPIALTCAITAGLTGMISALLWLHASQESADRFSNYAAAAFSGSMAIFGMGAISFPLSIDPLLQRIVEVWPWAAFVFGAIVLFLVAIDVWVKRRPSGDLRLFGFVFGLRVYCISVGARGKALDEEAVKLNGLKVAPLEVPTDSNAVDLAQVGIRSVDDAVVLTRRAPDA